MRHSHQGLAGPRAPLVGPQGHLWSLLEAPEATAAQLMNIITPASRTGQKCQSSEEIASVRLLRLGSRSRLSQRFSRRPRKPRRTATNARLGNRFGEIYFGSRPIRLSQDDAYLQFKFTLHARRFSRVNELKWDPKDKYDLVPPKKDLTNENLEDFFTDVFESTGKPSVQQGKKWVNHVLAKHHLPPVNKFNCGEQAFKIKPKIFVKKNIFVRFEFKFIFREENKNKNMKKYLCVERFYFSEENN